MLTAIVGIGCRFPGGVGTPAAFWDLLCAGADATTEVPRGRFEAEAEIAGHCDTTGMLNAVRGGFIEGIDAFDADFFGISPREARRIDPQQRLLLEVAWEALEDGGLPVDRLAGSSVGVYVGISSHDYADIQMRPENRHLLDVDVNAGGAASIAANRVSYLLDLRGPSIAVDTACSSALTALHLACRSLASKECDIAIVGAVNALLAAEPTIGFRQAAMLAPDGRCKPFDAAANGYVRSEGAGAIVLKPLDRAVADCDPVYAVIRGTAINQDGRTPGIVVPSLAAQQALLERALDEAGVAPCAVQYVEAHGTGTPVGDPVEARAIGNVMSRDRPSDRPCLIGSVKGNVGHLEAAAGIVGVIKAALALRHRLIPPTVNFVEPNPAIPFDELRLRVPTTLEEWPATEGPATAGVNSFGFGGANVHAVFEEPPAHQPAPVPSRSAEILTISARSGDALHELAAAHTKRLRSGDSFSLGELCYTAAVRRGHHEHRLAAVAGSKQDLADHLDAFLHGEARAAVADGRSPRDRQPGLAFIFSGMGPQWSGMGRQLLRDEPVFQSALEECDRLLRPIAGWSLLEELAADSARSRISDADLAHVANLAIQVALTELWRSWGIVPDAVAGHSSGEMGAAWAAGALSLPDALYLAFHRGRLQHRTTGTGGMLAAAISLDASRELLADHGSGVSVAAVNGPESVTFSGELETLGRIADALAGQGRFCRLLPVNVPYHGPQMDPLRDELMTVLANIDSRPPKIPVVSTATGTWQEERPFDAGYWWRNMRQPVLFAGAIDHMSEIGCELFVEVSPHPVLGNSINECLAHSNREGTVLPSLRRGDGDHEVMLRSLAALYVRGRKVEWSGVVGQGHRCIPLPPYPWQRERHWFDPTPDLRSHRSHGVDSGHPLLGRRLRAARPTWEADLGEPQLSYLDGHMLHDRVVLPGAAYVEIAFAAASELRGRAPLTIENVELERLLPLPERSDYALQCLVDDRDSVEVHSSPNSEPLDWTRRATARLGPHTDPPHCVDLPAIKARCSSAVDVDTLYKRMEDGHGLRYAGAFRSIAELWRRDDEVLARIEPPAGIDLSPDGYHVHPALLDAALQSLALATAAVLPANAVVLPVSIRRVELYASPGARFWSHASVDHTTDGTQVKGAIRLVDDAGQLLLVCHDVCLRVLAEDSRESVDDWLYEERWEHEPSPGQVRAGPATSDLATAVEPTLERLASESLGDYYATVEPALNALAVRYVAAGLHELGFDATIDVEATDALADHLGVIPRHRRYLTRLLQLARASGASTPTDPLPVDEGRYGAAVELVRESGRRLAATLRGDQDAREWLFRGESLDAVAELYSVHPLFGVYNAAIAEAVTAVQQARSPSPLRVLEVGGGTGGTTAAVLHRLSDDALEYVFTDISSFFVRSAKERFRDRPHIHADNLDIEQPQAGAGTYDVVIAADVVHATTDVRTTLRNMHSLLVPGGLLVLLEAIRRSAWLDLVFGQLDGWWRFRDRDLRRDNPLLGVREWERALVEANFADVCSLVDATGAGDPAQAVLLASVRSDGHHSPPRAARRWLVLTDRQGAGVEVAAALRERGDECVLAWKGVAYQRFGDGGVALSPTSAADWARLVDDQDRLDGVIHLWSLDAPGEPSVEELMAFQRLSTWTAVSLVQAFRATGRAVPDLWLVTVGAQVVGDEGIPTSVAQAPLWGLGRVLRNEQAAGRCRLVDLGPGCSPGDVEGLLAELDTNRADEIAFRAGRRYVRRIRRVNLEPTQRPRANLRLSPETASFSADVAEPGVLETLRLREMPTPVPGPGNVVIKTVAAGMNFRDVLLALDMPFVYGPNGESLPLGLECAGLVEACGEGVDGLRPGDEVIALASGSFASRVEASAELVVPKPAQLTFEEAATIPVAHLTAEYALRRLARLAAGELVLIHSATGGVGLAALQVARRVGARIFATAGSPEKRAYLASLGVEHVWDSRSLAFADDILQMTGGDGVDVVLNSLTGAGLVTSLGTLRTHGRFVELGRRDFHENRPLGLQPFLKNLAFFAFDLQEVVRDRPHEVGQVLRSLVSRIEAGELAPLPHREFDLADIEQAFRHMSQARHVGKVVLSVRRGSYPVCQRGRETIFNAAGSYLVTGGLGGFGLAVANWMVRAGARHIVLASRSGLPATEDETALDALMSTAANIVVTRCDIANPNDVQRVIAQIRASMPPLKGVIHTAMVLDDGALERLDWPRFEAVLAPKVAGAWNLHELTRDDDLECFVLFSSISALTGPPTQSSYAAANSFLGALAAHRRAEGRPAVAIDWGMISDVGYVARSPGLERRLTRYGLGTKGIAADQACSALERIIRHGVTRVAVSRTNLTEWSHTDAVDSALATPRVEHEHDAARPSPISASLVAVPAADRPAMLEHYLLQRTAMVLGTVAERVDPDRPLPDMGFDSLMAVELRAAIQSDLHVEVSIVDLLESLNLRQLTAEVLHRMSSDGHDS